MKIVISDLDHVSFDIETRVFEQAGLSFEKLDCLTEDDLISSLSGVHVVMNQYAPFTRRVFEALPDLKVIVRYGVGVNHIDLTAAAEFGVHVCNVPDYGMNEVSDHAAAMSLALIRKLIPMSCKTHEGSWDYQYSIPIHRASCMTVGVIGLGRIGSLYAQKMRAFGYKITGFDPAFVAGEASRLDFVQLMSCDEVLGSADLIAFFCPLTEETRGLIDANTISKMRNGAYIVNTARGDLVDEEALAGALQSNKLAGAGLDVCANEPLQTDSPLRGIKSCILTPHMAWYSEEAALELKRKVAEEALRYVRGEALLWDLTADLL